MIKVGKLLIEEEVNFEEGETAAVIICARPRPGCDSDGFVSRSILG